MVRATASTRRTVSASIRITRHDQPRRARSSGRKTRRRFPISAGNVGVPLEFRLGMREQQAEIDALVLNLSSSLTDAQLDELIRGAARRLQR